MSRNRKSHPGGRQFDALDGSGLAALRPHVEDLLARGKTRDAVEAAKRLYKETRSAAAEALLVDAYAARIRALIATGMSREARELASLVAERHPGTRGRILPLVRESAARVDGDLGPLLAALASADEATRREAETTLRRVLTDPRALADHPALPEGDPLRPAARAVSELFSAVTSGPLSDGALERLAMERLHQSVTPADAVARRLTEARREARLEVIGEILEVRDRLTRGLDEAQRRLAALRGLRARLGRRGPGQGASRIRSRADSPGTAPARPGADCRRRHGGSEHVDRAGRAAVSPRGKCGMLGMRATRSAGEAP